MLERILEGLERKGVTPEDRVTLALARVQGAWNKKSKRLLVGVLAEASGLGGQKSSSLENALISLATNAVSVFIGEGSIADTLLGHSVILPEEDRGVITLMALAEESRIKEGADGKGLSLFAAHSAIGITLENTLEKFNGKMEKFGGVLGGALKKIEPESPEVKSTERKMQEALAYFKMITGGSDENVLKNKNSLQERILVALGRQLGALNPERLLVLSSELNKKFDGDPILTSSFGAARRLLRSILERRVSDLNGVLEKIQEVKNL